MKEILRRWLPPLGWMGLIFFLSAQPDLPQAPDPWLELLLKKGAHATVYGVLALLYLRAFRGNSAVDDRLRLLSCLLVVAYGASDEFHQSFVPQRHPSAVDVLIDASGAMLALLLHRWWIRRPSVR